jgi:hypothetical protein
MENSLENERLKAELAELKADLRTTFTTVGKALGNLGIDLKGKSKPNFPAIISKIMPAVMAGKLPKPLEELKSLIPFFEKYRNI